MAASLCLRFYYICTLWRVDMTEYNEKVFNSMQPNEAVFYCI